MLSVPRGNLLEKLVVFLLPRLWLDWAFTLVDANIDVALKCLKAFEHALGQGVSFGNRIDGAFEKHFAIGRGGLEALFFRLRNYTRRNLSSSMLTTFV